MRIKSSNSIIQMRMGYKTIPFFGLDAHDTHEELEYAKMQNHFRQFTFGANAQNQFYVDQVMIN